MGVIVKVATSTPNKWYGNCSYTPIITQEMIAYYRICRDIQVGLICYLDTPGKLNRGACYFTR